MNNSSWNYILAMFLSLAIIVGWDLFFVEKKVIIAQPNAKTQTISENSFQKNIPNEPIKQVTEEKILIENYYLAINILPSSNRILDVTLKQYNQQPDADSEKVQLLNLLPNNNGNSFIETSYLSDNLEAKDSTNTCKIVNKSNISATIHCLHNDGLLSEIRYELDNLYMLNVFHKIINNTGSDSNIAFYLLINKSVNKIEDNFASFHQGLVGSFSQILEEVTFKDMLKKKKLSFTQTDWFGITDKYWLIALIPNNDVKATFSSTQNNLNKFQADFLTEHRIVKNNSHVENNFSIFIGPKKASILNSYMKEKDIKLFDRAIDYGWFYFMTKPMLKLLILLGDYVGSIALALIIMTFIVKLLMFPLAKKSFISMARLKSLQPKIEAIKQQYAEDKLKFNQKLVELYRKESVSPVSGCLPILIQIPVFFSLYKVFLIAIEMRHAPFYGWIKDMSNYDPTSILNLFGLLNLQPNFYFNLGLWPIIVSITMLLQQRSMPAPADPVQAQVMKFLPLIFLFMFDKFPAGLLIYWSISNCLTILQQFSLKYFYEK